jgi:hypothetical protein
VRSTVEHTVAHRGDWNNLCSVETGHPTRSLAMLDRTVTQFSHVKPDDTQFCMDGMRNFFIYRDLGVAEATAGKVVAQLVRANSAGKRHRLAPS